jgi:hypothetical protein
MTRELAIRLQMEARPAPATPGTLLILLPRMLKEGITCAFYRSCRFSLQAGRARHRDPPDFAREALFNLDVRPTQEDP